MQFLILPYIHTYIQTKGREAKREKGEGKRGVSEWVRVFWRGKGVCLVWGLRAFGLRYKYSGGKGCVMLRVSVGGCGIYEGFMIFGNC